jgi:hypothetical protein
MYGRRTTARLVTIAGVTGGAIDLSIYGFGDYTQIEHVMSPLS